MLLEAIFVKQSDCSLAEGVYETELHSLLIDDFEIYEGT